MKIEEIRASVEGTDYYFSHHADVERKADSLTIAQVEEALLKGEVLENYPDTGRGESCLVLGFSDKIPIHIVCGKRGEKLVIVTVYIPTPPKFKNPWTRGEKS